MTETIVLPIKPNYVPHWSEWECVREFIQNAKDEEDLAGNKMSVSYDGVLRIRNAGASLSRQALLIGATSKEGTGARGKFGEGLDLALLVAARQGIPLQIETKRERWTAAIEHVPAYDAECLVIHIDPRVDEGTGVDVEMGIARESWALFRHRFLFLGDDPEERVDTPQGSILLNPAYAGLVFVKGIFVERREGQVFGYDLANAEIDRDRRMIDSFDLNYRLGHILSGAVSTHPERMAAKVYAMVSDGALDTEGMSKWNTTERFHRMLAEHFTDAYGPSAYPVTTLDTASRVGTYGKKGVLVNDAMAEMLRGEFPSTTALEEEAARSVEATWGREELSSGELANLERAIHWVRPAAATLAPGLPPTQDRLTVVTFSGGTEWRCIEDTRQTQISRELLKSPSSTMRALVRCEAHAVALDAAGDGSEARDRIWSLIFERAIAQQPGDADVPPDYEPGAFDEPSLVEDGAPL